MSHALDLGVYPVEPGTHRIFLNRTIRPGKFWQTPRPEAVIVVGLGQEGKLQSARRRALGPAGRDRVGASDVAERDAKPKPLSLATTLIGSGGTGVNAGSSGAARRAGRLRSEPA